jgi:hypothetical protein
MRGEKEINIRKILKNLFITKEQYKDGKNISRAQEMRALKTKDKRQMKK